MTPAQPPPPTNWNLPFQLSGSHASISISESGDGRRIALTRQCAGAICGGAAPRPAGTNGPAATISAATIVVFGSATDFSDSQDAGDDASVAESAITAIIF